MSKQYLKVKSIMGREDAVKYLEELLASLKKGGIIIARGRESISLRPQEPIRMEFEADVKQKKDAARREKVTVALKWDIHEDNVRINSGAFFNPLSRNIQLPADDETILPPADERSEHGMDGNPAESPEDVLETPAAAVCKSMRRKSSRTKRNRI